MFDRVAGGRALKRLTIADDATHKAVAIEPSHACSGKHLVRLLQTLCAIRATPRVIRTDNGKEFCGKDMLIWAHDEKVDLRLIEHGKANQNAYIESFNGRLRDECLIEHLFMNLATHGRSSSDGDASTRRNGRRNLLVDWRRLSTPGS